MIIVEALETFWLQDFDKIIIENRKCLDTKGQIYKGDTFIVDEDMVDYLSGNNKLKKKVIKIVEIIPSK